MSFLNSVLITIGLFVSVIIFSQIMNFLTRKSWIPLIIVTAIFGFILLYLAGAVSL